jgi:hypothetical protein
MATPVFFSRGHTPNKLDCLYHIEQRILGALTDGGGGSGFTFGNYGGGPNEPTFTPATGEGAAVDTSDGTVWYYYSGSWH